MHIMMYLFKVICCLFIVPSCVWGIHGILLNNWIRHSLLTMSSWACEVIRWEGSPPGMDRHVHFHRSVPNTLSYFMFYDVKCLGNHVFRIIVALKIQLWLLHSSVTSLEQMSFLELCQSGLVPKLWLIPWLCTFKQKFSWNLEHDFKICVSGTYCLFVAVLRTLTDLLAVSMICKFSIKVNIAEGDEKQRFHNLLSHNIKSQKHLPNVDLSEMQWCYAIFKQ